MEAFSLLKYWRGGGGVFSRDTLCNRSSSSFSSSGSATLVTTVTPNSSSSDSDDEGNDEGPFFDLEFTLPDDEDDDNDERNSSGNQIKNQFVDGGGAVMAPEEAVLQESGYEVSNVADKESSGEGDVSDDEKNDGSGENSFTISSSSAVDPNDAAAFPTGSSSNLVNAASETTPKLPVPSILKSATKFRVQMPKFNNKSKKHAKSEALEKKSVQHKGQSETKEKGVAGGEEPKPSTNNKLLTVKLKVEEVMPLVSLLFSRDSSTNSKGATSNSNSKENKRNDSEIEGGTTVAAENCTSSSSSEDEKKFARELMHKYLKKVKPLYVRVSKRYGDKLKIPGQLSNAPKSPTPPPENDEKPPLPVVKAGEEEGTANGAGVTAQEVCTLTGVMKGQKQGNLHAGLRVVCKHLGKSRSASASAPVPAAGTESSRRRDDSLLLQQDGIQSAIMHCKRSFNASRDMEGTILSTRSVRISSDLSKIES